MLCIMLAEPQLQNLEYSVRRQAGVTEKNILRETPSSDELGSQLK